LHGAVTDAGELEIGDANPGSYASQALLNYAAGF